MAHQIWIPLIALLVGVMCDSEAEEVLDTDWRGQGKLSTVGDQASCNGCVAFSLAGALEWYAANLTDKLIPLSVQYLIDCGIDEYTGLDENGCAGGSINVEVDEIMSTQYVPHAQDYTYKSNFVRGRCDEYHAREKLLRNALSDLWVYTYIPISQSAWALRKALETGPAIVNLYVSNDAQEWKDSEIHDDDQCVSNPLPHSLAFVGWQSNNGNPYFIARNSYGESYGEHGYVKYADSEANLRCQFQNNAYSISVGRRRELEYRLGEGLKSFTDSRKWCQAQGKGWDLAHIPTQMHNLEVYDLFTKQFGDDKKTDEQFNFYWIGLALPDDKWMWVDGDAEAETGDITGTEAHYLRFKHNVITPKYTVVDKVNHGEHRIRGTWATKPRAQTYRFVCSRYYNEVCPRITHTAIDNAYSVRFYDKKGKTTLDIDNKTKAKVCCMKGFKPVGKPGQCKNGKWKKLPSCKADKKDKEDLSEVESLLFTAENCSED